MGAPRAEVSGILVRWAGARPGGVQAGVWKRPISQMATVTIWKQLAGSLLPHYTPHLVPHWRGGAEVAVGRVAWCLSPASPAGLCE